MPTITGEDIATQALKYKGVPYVWAGWRPTGWDCSGFVGWVLAHDLGMTLPLGMRWPYNFHPPVAAAYKVWSKAKTVGTASPGDLCCWLTHIGIAINDHQMISAYDTQLGTAITAIRGAGPTGEPLSIRQINKVAASMPPGPVSPGPPAQGCASALPLMPYYLAKGLVLHARHKAGP